MNKWVLWIFIFSMFLIYLNYFTPKIIVSDYWFKMWIVSENIFYSLVAACIFYFFLEVLPKVKAQKDYFSYTFLMHENLVNNLKFLDKILDSVPEDISKIEEVIYNSDFEIPQSLVPLNDLSILSIINRINEKAKLEIRVFEELYGISPKNIMESLILKTLEILNSEEIPAQGKIAEIKSKIELHFSCLSLIEANILEFVNLKKKN